MSLDSHISSSLFSFRVAGIPVRVEPMFLFTTLVLASSRRSSIEDFAGWLAVVFVSVLLHELGHALVGRRFGLTPEIRLYGWGGLTSWSAGGPVNHARTVAISLAGPLTGIVTGGLVAALLATFPLPVYERPHQILSDFVWASAYWGALNLIPLQPLDGSHAFEALWAMAWPQSAARAARATSAAAGLLVGAVGLYFHWMIPGIFALWLGIESARRIPEERREAHDAPLVERYSPIIAEAFEQRDGARLSTAASELLGLARTGRIRRWAAENLAMGRAFEGDIEGAVEALASSPRSHRPAASVEAFVVAASVARGRWRAVEAWKTESSPEAAASVEGAPKNPAGEVNDVDRWGEAVSMLREPGREPLDAVRFARVREAASVLGRDREAAAIGHALLATSPDPDLAFALAYTWARAGDAKRAASLLVEALNLGFRDWERLDATIELTRFAGERAWRQVEEARRSATPPAPPAR